MYISNRAMIWMDQTYRTPGDTSFGPSPCKFGILSGFLVAESASVALTAKKASVTFSFT